MMLDNLYALAGIAFLYACFRVGGISSRLYSQGHRALPLMALVTIFFLVARLP